MEYSKFRLYIQVRISQIDQHGNERHGGIEINETKELTAGSFMELCQILSQFHELSLKLQKEK